MSVAVRDEHHHLGEKERLGCGERPTLEEVCDRMMAVTWQTIGVIAFPIALLLYHNSGRFTIPICEQTVNIL